MSVFYRLHQDQSEGTKRSGKWYARMAKAFSVADNIEGLRVVFMPENTHDASGNRTKQFLQGCKVEELPSNKVEKIRQRIW